MSGDIPGPLADRARAAAALIAERLADTDRVEQAVRASVERAANPFGWGGPSLLGGHAGQALCFEYAARADPGSARRWRAAAKDALRSVARHSRETPLTDASFGYGTAGLALALSECAAHEPGYARALASAHATLAEQVHGLPRLREPDGADPLRYDLIQGGAGVLGYLASVPDPNAALRSAAERLVDDLAWRFAPVTARNGNDRRYVAPRFLEYPEDAARYPDGYLDLGLAHGIAGPLAALSRAWRAGYRRPGLFEALRHTADQMVAWSVTDEWGRNWPRILPLDAVGAPLPTAGPVGRLAWCYGAPGICSALLDAAIALGDDRLRTVAADGLRSDLRRSLGGDRRLDTATLCHGAAGVLTIAQKFAAHGDAAIGAHLADLTERVLDGCDPELPLVVQQIHTNARETGLDTPSVLEGSAGVALALWTVAGDTDRRWHRALLVD
ncbi:lanthionine synthetase C family protein [Glycomyces scopariae]